MNTIYHSRFWWLLALAALAVVVPTAAAQARPAQAAASSRGMFAATGSVNASRLGASVTTGLTPRSGARRYQGKPEADSQVRPLPYSNATAYARVP